MFVLARQVETGAMEQHRHQQQVAVKGDQRRVTDNSELSTVSRWRHHQLEPEAVWLSEHK